MIVRKYGCSSATSRFEKNASMAEPPNCPGGRLIPWTTISSSVDPGGRSSQFGEITLLTPSSQPVLVSIFTRFGYRSTMRSTRLMGVASRSSIE